MFMACLSSNIALLILSVSVPASFNVMLNLLNVGYPNVLCIFLNAFLYMLTSDLKISFNSFSATLMPDGEYCYLSTLLVTAINNQPCSEIAQIKAENNQNLQVSVYAEGNYTILTPSDGSFQAILTKSGENSCTMTESRMMWPGK